MAHALSIGRSTFVVGYNAEHVLSRQLRISNSTINLSVEDLLIVFFFAVVSLLVLSNVIVGLFLCHRLLHHVEGRVGDGNEDKEYNYASLDLRILLVGRLRVLSLLRVRTMFN